MRGDDEPRCEAIWLSKLITRLQHITTRVKQAIGVSLLNQMKTVWSELQTSEASRLLSLKQLAKSCNLTCINLLVWTECGHGHAVTTRWEDMVWSGVSGTWQDPSHGGKLADLQTCRLAEVVERVDMRRWKEKKRDENENEWSESDSTRSAVACGLRQISK
jgi:hypothetical protein